MGCRRQGFWGGGCRGSLREERLGLPHAWHSKFQRAPLNPMQGTAEPLSRAGGTSAIMFKKGQSTAQAVRSEGRKKVWGTTLQTPKWEKEEGRRCSRRWGKDSPAAPGNFGREHTGADSHTVAHGWPQAGVILLKDCRLMGRTPAGAGKSVRSEELLRTDHSPASPPGCLGVRGR